jgi:NAD-dependent DNA ligase
MGTSGFQHLRDFGSYSIYTLTRRTLVGHKLLQKFLMASFLYYQMNRSPISDCEFDQVCQDLLAEWDNFEHQHKYLVTPDDLRAGTGFAIKTYPLMVRHAALRWLDDLGDKGITT